MYVYLVEHVREKEDGEVDFKTIGVFSSEETAKNAIRETTKLEGFVDYADGLQLTHI